MSASHSEGAWVFLKIGFLHAAAYLIKDYSQLAGDILTTISIIYVSFKLTNEYLIPFWKKYIKKA